MNTKHFNIFDVQELTFSETSIISGGATDGVAHEVGEAVGYVCGFIFTGGRAIVQEAISIASIFK